MTGPLKLEEVSWNDHWNQSGWCIDAERADYAIPQAIKSVGYFVRETKEGLLFARDYDIKTGTVGGCLFLLKSCVTKRRKIK